MTKMKKLLLLPLLALAFSAHADEREWLPYKKLVEQMRIDKFYAIAPSERDKLTLYLAVTPVNKNLKPADVVLSVVTAEGRQPLPMVDGRLLLTPNPRWMNDDAKVWTNVPKGEKSKLDYVVTTPVPAGLQWNYATLMGSVPQANSAIKQMAGVFSMMAPKIDVVILKFAKPAELKIQGKDGVKLYNSDARQAIKLKFDAALLKENPTITVSERPTEAELDELE
jgi:hypothetical protein